MAKPKKMSPAEVEAKKNKIIDSSRKTIKKASKKKRASARAKKKSY